jgi:hypothetical protein
MTGNDINKQIDYSVYYSVYASVYNSVCDSVYSTIKEHEWDWLYREPRGLQNN